jgi:hypothetical protein
MRWLAYLLGVTGLLASLALIPAAQADSNAVTISGSGTIDPGLPCPASTGCAMYMAFTLALAGQDALGTASCSFSGSDNTPGGGTVQHGEGNGTIACAGGVNVSGTISFDRTLSVVQVAGTITLNGDPGTVQVTLAWVPGGPPPVTTFSMHGGGTMTTYSEPPPPPTLPPTPSLGPAPTLPPVPTVPPGSCNVVNTGGACVDLATGNVIQTVSVQGAQTGTSGSHRVVGAVDMYRFPLPSGGFANVPCVVLTADAAGNSGCTLAGGTFVSRFATLVDQSVAQPSAGPGAPVTTVRVCEALLTVTVAGFGVEDVPSYALC